MEDFIYSYKKMFANYFIFEGRTSRNDYWQAIAINIIIGAVLMMLSRLLPIFGTLSYIYGVAAIVPVLAMTVRRLHDTDKSGWWALAAFFPALNIILVAYCCMAEAQRGGNRFGY
ncbi:DUF805 domain-containing protein [Cloacibacillus porcorum]|uniref:DUF805 domain-containing protein n=1 Tax=Cloacibacillus porcorum TaxID=1197717 RepID=UPI003F0F1E7F